MRIEDGRITAIGRRADLETTSTDVIDAAGAFLMPGLAHMHVHYGPAFPGGPNAAANRHYRT